MKNKIKISVRYCGGCNPRYDRTIAVYHLQKLFPQIEFCSADNGTGCDHFLMISGCTVGCARNGSHSGINVFSVRGISDIPSAVKWLQYLVLKKENPYELEENL